MEPYIVFTNTQNNKEIFSMTVRGTFEDEIKSTKELLACENSIHESDIKTSVENR